MFVLRIYYRQTNYQQSNSNNTNMIPKQQNVNDYGFKFNHKDMVSPTKYGINFTSKNQMIAKFQTNYASTGSNPVPNSPTNAQNQETKVLGFRRKYPHHRQGNIINSKHYIAQYNTKEKETNKYQNSHPSTTESLRSDHQIFGDHPKLINKQVKLIEKLGDNSPKYNLFNQKTQNEAFYDLLYKIIGILSCHVRVNQRLALYKIIHNGESVKKQGTEFYFLIRNLIIKRLKNGMLCLKMHATHNKNKQIKQDCRRILQEKPTLYEDLKEQIFQMEQSAVEKGLKFLQDRSNLRRRTQQQMIVDRKQLKQAEQVCDKKKTELGLKNQKPIDGEINLRNDPYLTDNLKKKQNQASQMMTKNINRVQSQQNLFSGNKIHQLKTDVNKKSVDRQSSESIKNLPNILINPHLNKRSANKKQPMQRNLSLQRQSVISRQASWVILQLEQQPYIGLQNRKQLFERVETSQRKYYLNPNAYKQAEPDPNHNALALSSRSSVDQVEIYDEQADNEHANLFHSEQNMAHQNALPMFQYGHNDNVIQSWDGKQQQQKYIQKNKNSISSKSNKPNVYKNNQTEFENLPSFNEKNALFYKKSENQIQKFHQKLRVENNNERNQQKKTEQKDKEKKKTAQQIKYQIKSSKQSSFKISDEDYSVEEKIQQKEHASKYSANKVHQIEEYFTDSNIFQQKNKKKIKAKQQNIRSSYDFPLQNQDKIHTNANILFERPKSISASSNTLHQPLFGLKQERVIQGKNSNPMIRSQTLLPRININYQSPRNYVFNPNTQSNKVVYQSIQNLQIQLPQAQAQFHRQSHPIIEPHPQQTKPNNYFHSQNKIYPQKVTQINSPNRVYTTASSFYGPNSFQNLQRSQNYQATMKPGRNQYRIERPNNQACYQSTQMVPGYVRTSFGINSARQVIESRPTSYSAYQEGAQKGIYNNPTHIYQSQVPHPTQSNQRYLNINKSSIKKGIDISQNPMSNTVWNEKMLKHSKSDQQLNLLQGKGQGYEQTGHKNNKKLKVTTAEYEYH